MQDKYEINETELWMESVRILDW